MPDGQEILNERERLVVGVVMKTIPLFGALRNFVVDFFLLELQLLAEVPARFGGVHVGLVQVAEFLGGNGEGLNHFSHHPAHALDRFLHSRRGGSGDRRQNLWRQGGASIVFVFVTHKDAPHKTHCWMLLLMGWKV